jgi:hypothetical protein
MDVRSAKDEEEIAMPIIIDVVLCISTFPCLRFSTQTQIACYAYSALPYRWLAYFSSFYIAIAHAVYFYKTHGTISGIFVVFCSLGKDFREEE